MPINPGWFDAVPPIYYYGSEPGYSTMLLCATGGRPSLSNLPICPHCSGAHDVTKCPFIKSITYYPNGTIKRIEFK